MTRPDFRPCTACEGRCVLCAGCVHNRRLIANLKSRLRHVKLLCEDAEADFEPLKPYGETENV